MEKSFIIKNNLSKNIERDTIENSEENLRSDYSIPSVTLMLKHLNSNS